MRRDVSDKTKKYKVSIFGENYLLAGDELELHVEKAAQLIDFDMRELSSQVQLADSRRIAVLVALRFACKFLAATKTIQDQDDTVNKLVNLIDKVDSL